MKGSGNESSRKERKPTKDFFCVLFLAILPGVPQERPPLHDGLLREAVEDLEAGVVLTPLAEESVEQVGAEPRRPRPLDEERSEPVAMEL